MSARLQIIDIGHRGYSLDRALSELEAAVSDCVFGGKTRAIKVIHGHGTGALKRGVREWCEDQMGRFQAVIIGENYDLLFNWSILSIQKRFQKCFMVFKKIS